MRTIVVSSLLFFFACFVDAKAQSNDATSQQQLSAKIAALDQELFEAFNACNLEKVSSFFAEDIEFYHEKEGLLTTRTSVIDVMKKNLCSENSNRLRRELIKSTFEVRPINTYGAVETGEHRFYLTQKGQKEKLDGIGKFVHIWENKDGAWRISRVISYGFRPPD